MTFMPSLGIKAEEMPDSDQYGLDLMDAVFTRFSQPKTREAVLQDWDKSRRDELDAFSKYVVQKGREMGMPTPVNQAIVDLAVRIESPSAFVGGFAPSSFLLRCSSNQRSYASR